MRKRKTQVLKPDGIGITSSSISNLMYKSPYVSNLRLKYLICIFLALGASSTIYGQIPSTAVEFEGKTGILIPRVSTAERTAIYKPVDGLLVYDSTLNHFYYYSLLAENWVSIRIDKETPLHSSRTSENLQIPHDPSSGANWNVQGNVGADLYSSDPPLLGTADSFPLVFITNDLERMRILADGNIIIVRSLEVGENLNVKQNVDLNTQSGETMNHGPFTVANQSPTILTGSLTSEQNVNLNTQGGETRNHGPLTVTNLSPTLLTGKLTVDQKTLLNLGLEVYGSTTLHGLFKVADNYTSLFTGPVTISDPTQSASASISSGALVVGGGVGIGKNLNVGGNLDIAGSSSFGGPVSFASPVSITALDESNSPTTGALIVSGGTGVGKRLNVGGATALNNTLLVAGATTLGNTLGVTGATTLGSTLGVVGATTMSSTLGVTGATTLSNTLGVTGATTLMSSLGVTGPSTLGSTLNVTGAATLSSTLGVTGATTLMSSLGVTGASTLNSTLNVTGASTLGSTLGVTGAATLMSTLGVTGNLSVNTSKFTVDAVSGNTVVDGTLTTNGLMTLNNTLNVNGSGPYIANFVNAADQNGISIKIAGNPDNANNYITFQNGSGATVGRIEGQTASELNNDPEHVRIKDQLDLSVTIASIQVATASLGLVQAGVQLVGALSSSTACAGLGACITAPIPSLIAAAIAAVAARTANLVAVSIGLDKAKEIRDDYDVYKAPPNLGITYQSGAGDYAEWLPKANKTEDFIPGFVVGIKNGRISLNTLNADKVLVISTNPIVLGNMPPEGNESEYEKIAFMGQVPVHVIGKVNMGDYILPSGNDDGLAKAVSPSKMTADDYARIVGMAWSASTNDAYNQINVAIGLNDGDIGRLVSQQKKEIDGLHKEIENLRKEKSERNTLLAKLVPGYREALGISEDDITETNITAIRTENARGTSGTIEIVTPGPHDIVYFEITRDQIIEGINLAEKMYTESGGDVNTHPFWTKMKTDSTYREEVLTEMEKKLEKSIHTHKSINEVSAQRH